VLSGENLLIHYFIFSLAPATLWAVRRESSVK
jgi:hypothetical protein